VGKRGSGKTCLTIKLSEMLFPGYDYNIHHTYKLSDYLKGVDVIEPFGCLAYEEAGTSLDRARWQSPTNRIFSENSQTDRYKNFVTFIVLPDVSLLAKNHIKMVEFLLWVTKRGNFTFYRNVRIPIDISSKMNRIYLMENYNNVPLPSMKNLIKYIARDQKEKDEKRKNLITDSIIEEAKEEEIRAEYQPF
jgi:hypothetical protein